MDVAITKISSKGQVIIPTEMRKDFHEGDKVLIIHEDGRLIMKKATKLEENLKDDLVFAERTEKAWNSYEKGEFKSKDSKDFLNSFN